MFSRHEEMGKKLKQILRRKDVDLRTFALCIEAFRSSFSASNQQDKEILDLILNPLYNEAVRDYAQFIEIEEFFLEDLHEKLLN